MVGRKACVKFTVTMLSLPSEFGMSSTQLHFQDDLSNFTVQAENDKLVKTDKNKAKKKKNHRVARKSDPSQHVLSLLRTALQITER